MSEVAHRLAWDRALAERYWRAVHEGGLPQAGVESDLANVVLAALAPWIEQGADLIDAGGRTGDGVRLALSAGFHAARLDLTELCRPLGAEITAHPRWHGTVTAPGRPFDAAFVVDLPAQLLEDEIEDYFRLVRSLLAPGGRFAFSVPNGEDPDQGLAIDPADGAMFHPMQHVRGFTGESLTDLLARSGFEVLALHQVEKGRHGLVGGNDPFARMAREEGLYLGSGDTLVVVAGLRDDSGETGETGPVLARWQDVRRRAEAPLPLREWEWTQAGINRFWSLVAGTPLDALSFGRQNGANLLCALEGWLTPGGRHLDVGAGDGHVVRLLAEAGYPAGALEPAEGRRAILDAKLAQSPHFLGCIEGPRAGEPFDVVLAFEVIEHIATAELPAFLAGLADCLVPGGILILSTPSREDLAASRVYSPVSGHVFHRWQHLQSWTPERLRGLVEAAGFTVEVHHEIDLAGIAKGRHPYFDALLAGRESRRIGDGANLVLVARKGSAGAGPRDIAMPGARALHPSAKPPQPGSRAELDRDEAPSGAIEGGAVLPSSEARPAADGTPPEEAAAEAGGEPSASTAPVVPWPSRTTRMANRLAGLAERGVALARPAARRLLPDTMKKRLAPYLVALEKRQASLAARTEVKIPLAQTVPLLPPDAFTGGPIVLVNNALAWGGVERQVVNTLKGLESLTDRDLHLLCLKLGNGPDYDFYAPALSGARCAVRNAVAPAGVADALAAVPGADAASIKAMITWMPPDVREDLTRFLADFLRLRPAVVHAWQDGVSLAAGFAAKLAGVPRILVSSRNMNPTNFAYFRPYMRRAYRELAACADIVMINNSEAGARDYADWLDLPPGRWTVVRNGIDPGEFSRADGAAAAEFRRSIGVPEGGLVVGSVFRFYDEKRPMLWIETAALVARRHPQCRFVVFGTGPLRGEMEAAAAAAGFADRLHLPGTITQTSLGLSLFDVFLLTSSFEGTPNVVLEASSLGVPVVATDAGGTREAVEEGVTGSVVARADAALLAEKVGAILADPAGWGAVRAKGPAFVETRFGLDRMLRETLALYRLHDVRSG